MRGTLTLLFTDIEGSTQLLHRLGDRYAGLLAEHHRVMREAIARAGGREVKTAGDSFFAIFPHAEGAVECALHFHLGVRGADWPGGEAPRVRMGIHTGSPEVRDGDFVGMDVHRAARVMAVAHGGQVLVTDETRRAIGTGRELRDLGYHRLKDLPEPEHLFQVLAIGLESEFPELRSLNRSNLPVPANPLVGRRAETEQALALLARPEIHLLTLQGVGGAGKTRLAVEVAGEAVTRYRDGVWIVLLAPIVDPSLMVSEVARVLGVEPVAEAPLETTLVRTLAERELLLVLDNFEHLLDAAEVVAQLLTEAPKLDVLTTSREALRISAEHLMEVPPLPPADAAELFVARAVAVRPDLTVEGEDREVVGRICERLDGLPLALELAAARIALFGPRALEARLANSLALPQGPRDLPARQRTLRATIDWSYGLLDSGERALFARLAVFAGGWTLTSAEAVCGASLDTVQSLVEKNLVRRVDERFVMLETIREYSLERLEESGESDAQRARHAEHFLAFAEEAAPELEGKEGIAWSRRVEDEHDNLRAALEHFVRFGDADRELRLIAAIWRFWFDYGYWDESRRALERALAASSGVTPDRVRALQGASWIAQRQGDVQPALRFAEEALRLSRELDDAWLIGRSLRYLARPVQLGGDSDRATALYEESARLSRAAGDLHSAAAVVNNLACRLLEGGEYRRATELFDDALAMNRASGNQRSSSVNLLNLGDAQFALGNLQASAAYLAESLTTARALGFREVIVEALYALAGVAGAGDEPRRAAVLLGAASRAGDFGHIFEGDFDRRVYERTVETARRALGAEALDAAIEAGRAMTLDDAIAFATAAPSTPVADVGRGSARSC